jgi:hypothetical protein
MINVSHGQWVKMATNKAAVEIKNNNQYMPFDFFCTSMANNLTAKIGELPDNFPQKIHLSKDEFRTSFKMLTFADV